MSAPDRDPLQDRGPEEPSLAPGGPRGIFGEPFRSLLSRLLLRLIRRLLRRLSGSRSQGRRAVAPARRLAPAGVAAALLIALTALSAALAQAQSVLVSNADQLDFDTPSIEQAAQSFTTGSNTSGYALISIVLNCSCQGYTSGTVTLHSGSRTGSKVADFTANVAMDDLVLTPTQTVTLSANTTYVIDTGDNFDAGTTWFITNSDSEDDGAAAGWSIAKDSEFYQTGTSSWVASSSAYQFTVNGNALGITPSGLQLDAPSGTAGFLRVRWGAASSSAEAYHVRAHPTVDTFGQRAKYLTGNRLVRADADADANEVKVTLEAAWGTGRGHGMVGSPYGRADGSGGLRLGCRIEPDADHAVDARLDLWAGPGADGDGRKAGAGLQ